jgi:hypothetical protein
MAQQIIIWEATPYVVRDAGLENPMDWDVFISHASEDKPDGDRSNLHNGFELFSCPA